MRSWFVPLAALITAMIPGWGGADEPPTPTAGLVFEHAVAASVVRVIDGDTLAIGDARVRLVGINAPERNEPGGALATGALTLMVTTAELVLCVVAAHDRWGRSVGRCFVLPGGLDLSSSQVEDGYARSDARFSAGRPEAEARAQAEARGLWACASEAPEAWREIKQAWCR